LRILNTKTMARLARFLEAQVGVFERARSELAGSGKTSHWIWYIFPQRKGLGSSYNATYYGLDDDQEIVDYVQHPVLGPRYFDVVSVAHGKLVTENGNVQRLMGSSIDVMKLKSSLGTFVHVIQDIEPKTEDMNTFLVQANEIKDRQNWTYQR
jgi:uncharacterized protein (DUF1810 family)